MLQQCNRSFSALLNFILSLKTLLRNKPDDEVNQDFLKDEIDSDEEENNNTQALLSGCSYEPRGVKSVRGKKTRTKQASGRADDDGFGASGARVIGSRAGGGGARAGGGGARAGGAGADGAGANRAETGGSLENPVVFKYMCNRKHCKDFGKVFVFASEKKRHDK